MFKHARTELGKLTVVAALLTAVWIAAVAPAAQAARNSTSVKYDALIGDDDTTDLQGLYGDQGAVSTYGPITSSFLLSYTNTSARTFTAVLALEDGTVLPGFPCQHGLIAGGDNPLVTCYSDSSENHGYFIDFPPYGNDNKRNRAANPACATFTPNDFGGYKTEVPSTCFAQVSHKENGVTKVYNKVSMPFTFETQIHSTTTTP